VYRQTAASYRQTVLTAFQNVEDNLVALRILRQEEAVQKKAVKNAKLLLRLTNADYQAGTVDLTSVLVAETTAFTAEQNDVNVRGRQMIAAVGLITALGGGWDSCQVTGDITLSNPFGLDFRSAQ
jgi:outer membrane protein TolC